MPYIKTTATILGKIFVDDTNIKPIAEKTLENGEKLYIYECDTWTALVGTNMKTLDRVLLDICPADKFKRDVKFKYNQNTWDSTCDKYHYFSEFKTLDENYFNDKERSKAK